MAVKRSKVRMRRRGASPLKSRPLNEVAREVILLQELSGVVDHGDDATPAQPEQPVRKKNKPYRYSPRTKDAKTASKMKFLEEFARTKLVGYSAAACGRDRHTMYVWRTEDEEFAKAWDSIWANVVDQLETSAMNRAIKGYARPVYQQGKLVGAESVHAPNLTIFMLSRNKPDQYGFKTTPATNPNDSASQLRAAMAAMDQANQPAAEEDMPPTAPSQEVKK